MNTGQGQRLPVVYSLVALRELDAIWDWNEKNYGRDHAARYLDFLQRHIGALGERHHRGRVIESRPDLRYAQIKRRKRGHGHVAVYRVTVDKVEVLHILHTAQNLQTILAENEPGL